MAKKGSSQGSIALIVIVIVVTAIAAIAIEARLQRNTNLYLASPQFADLSIAWRARLPRCKLLVW